MTRGYKDLSVAHGSILQLLMPPVIALGGVVFLNKYSGIEMFGAGLILTGCLLTAQTRPRLASGLPAKEIKSDHPPPPERSLG